MISFGSVSMLFWGLAIAVPIILHLLRKRKSRTVSWGAMRFLQIAMVKRSKRFELWRVILLLLRIAVIALLALAVARPLIDESRDAGVGDRGRLRTLNIFVFDTSYSMRAMQTGGSRFDVARRAATEVVEDSESGDGFLLLDMGRQPAWIGNGVSYRAAEVTEAIERLEPGEGTADLGGAISALELLIGETLAGGWEGSVRVCFFSDLQPLTWSVVGSGSLVEERFEEFAEADLELLVVDCGATWASGNGPTSELEAVPGNQVVVDLQTDRRGTGNGSGTAIGAEVRSFGGVPKEPESLLVQLLVDERIRQSQRFALGTDKSRSLNWSENLRPGRHLLEVRLAAEDAIALDNVHRSLIESRGAVPVALFAGSPQASRFLALAAEPSGGGANGGERDFRFLVREYGIDELASSELGRERLWVLCDPEPLDPRSLGRLEQHLQQGGGVIWWLGPNWRSGSGGLAALGDDPGDMEGAAGENWIAVEKLGGDGANLVPTIDPLEYEDPIIAPFEPFPGSGLLTLPVFRYWRLELGDRWKTALGISVRSGPETPASTGGQSWDALIARLERSDGSRSVGGLAGGGREVIVATPPGPGNVNESGDERESDPWNALIAWPAFVPLVQEIFYWASTSEDVPTDFVVGQPIAGKSLESEFGTKVVSSAGDALRLEIVETLGNRISWSGGIAERSGVYRWAEGPGEGELAFVVNVDSREGDISESWNLVSPFKRLERRAGNVLAESEIVGDAGMRERGANEAETATADLDAGVRGGRAEVGWWFLLLAIGFLVGESVVVRFLEHRF